MDKKLSHLLSLKVIRLTRPSLDLTFPLPHDLLDQNIIYDHEGDNFDLTSNELPYFGLNNLLLLPQSFGNIYLGETFTCFMSLHNDSDQSALDLSFKADLHTSTQEILLTGQAAGTRVNELLPDHNVNDVINHEVKEIGNHFLVCKVSYSLKSGEQKSFSKNFRFQVLKPLDVKTKFYNAEDYLSDEVYLEAQLQNLISVPIFLENVSLEPSSHFNVRKINSLDANDFESNNQSVFGSVNCLNYSDSRQYLFCMTPKPEIRDNTKFLKGVTGIGKLDIIWRTAMGERGRLQTSQLERMAPGYGDVRLTVEAIPSIVALEEPFSIVLKVLNSCERTMDLMLSFDGHQSGRPLLWEGVSGRQLGKIQPHSSIDVSLRAIPLCTGLQSISGLRLRDTFLQRNYDYDDIAQVFVSAEQYQ